MPADWERLAVGGALRMAAEDAASSRRCRRFADILVGVFFLSTLFAVGWAVLVVGG